MKKNSPYTEPQRKKRKRKVGRPAKSKNPVGAPRKLNDPVQIHLLLEREVVEIIDNTTYIYEKHGIRMTRSEIIRTIINAKIKGRTTSPVS